MLFSFSSCLKLFLGVGKSSARVPTCFFNLFSNNFFNFIRWEDYEAIIKFKIIIRTIKNVLIEFVFYKNIHTDANNVDIYNFFHTSNDWYKHQSINCFYFNIKFISFQVFRIKFFIYLEKYNNIAISIKLVYNKI